MRLETRSPYDRIHSFQKKHKHKYIYKYTFVDLELESFRLHVFILLLLLLKKTCIELFARPCWLTRPSQTASMHVGPLIHSRGSCEV